MVTPSPEEMRAKLGEPSEEAAEMVALNKRKLQEALDEAKGALEAAQAARR